MKKTTRTFTARSFRIILALVLVVQLAAGVALFVYGRGQLVVLAEEVSRKNADADASGDTLSHLQTLQQQLDRFEDVPALVQNLRATSDLPQFQAVNDITNIANRLGLSIENVSFADSDTTTSQPATGSGGTATTNNSVTINFELSNPVSYETLIEFLNAIETNTPKLQISGITLPQDSSRSAIEPGVLTLQLFVAS